MTSEEKDHALGNLFTSALLSVRGLRPSRSNGYRQDANGRWRDSKGRFVRDPNKPVTRHNRKSEYPSGIRKPVRDKIIRDAPRDKKGEILDYKGRPIKAEDITLDHELPVVKHWETQGRFQTRAERAEWFNDPKNLRIMSRSENSSLGAKVGKTYHQSTGPGYSPD